MFKLRLYKFLSTFIPYFRRKLMNEIYNAIKNALNNRIKSYPNEIFSQTLSTINPETPYIIKYATIYMGVSISIEIEYTKGQIKFNPFIGAINSSSILSEINNFVMFIESMPQEDLMKRINFKLNK